jgi:hypothetical protein
VLAAQAARSEADIKAAQADDATSVFRFADVMGPGFRAESLPFATGFFRDVGADLNSAIGPAKDRYNRPRPVVEDPHVEPVVKAANASFPSGTATFAYGTAILLADMVPENAAAIFERADTYAHNRVVAGVHYPTDIEGGGIAASVIDSMLLRDVVFMADFARLARRCGAPSVSDRRLERRRILGRASERAQQPNGLQRIGVLMFGDANDPIAQTQLATLRDGLRRLGWVEGRNLQGDSRQPRARPTEATSPRSGLAVPGKDVDALPAAPETVAAYLASEAENGLAASTITRRCAAIRCTHRLADLEPPTNSERVRATLRGIRGAIGAAPARKAPVLAETARAAALSAPDSRKDLRDRALLLLGFAGAFRRSELVALNVADLEESEDGPKIVIRRSKTDQEGHGETIAIMRGGGLSCPVKAVRAWMQAASISEGCIIPTCRQGQPAGYAAAHGREC